MLLFLCVRNLLCHSRSRRLSPRICGEEVAVKTSFLDSRLRGNDKKLKWRCNNFTLYIVIALQ